MGIFVRVTLLVAAVIVAVVALVFVLKLLVIAGIIAALALGVTFAVRGLQRRLAASRSGRVTALTARR